MPPPAGRHPSVPILESRASRADAARPGGARLVGYEAVRTAWEQLFAGDAKLDKALAAVAQRTGVELAWLAAPRSQLNVAVRGHDHELDPGVKHELAGLRTRVAPLSGKLRRNAADGYTTQCDRICQQSYQNERYDQGWFCDEPDCDCFNFTFCLVLCSIDFLNF